MPSHAGISITLQSQYDAATIPETEPRIFTPTPTLRSLNLNGDFPRLTQHPDKVFQELHGPKGGDGVVVETEVPVFERSQFWVRYECRPPGTPEQNGKDDDEEEDVSDPHGQDAQEREEDVKYFYFKLFTSGRCITSWGVGEQDGWKGKLVFGLFDGGRDFEGKRIVEKRGLFFPGVEVCGDDGFEIRVYRAKARRREQARYQSLGEISTGRGDKSALDLTTIGKVQRGERQRFYSYALIDAKDEPWVVFRYRFEKEGESYQALFVEYRGDQY